MEERLRPGLLLVGGVNLKDGVFDESVVLLLDHDETGSLGVVLNRFAGVDLGLVLPGWVGLATHPARMYDGGPVSPEGAICLASPAHDSEDPPGWRELFDRVGLLHLDTPVEIAEGAYRALRIFAGYAGWAPGQLEQELHERLWYVTDARPGDAFDSDPTTLWRRCLKRLDGELGWLSTWTDSPELN